MGLRETPPLAFHYGLESLSTPKSRIASPFASEVSSQTQVSQGFPQGGSVLPVSIAEKLAFRWRFLVARKSRILGPKYLGAATPCRSSRRKNILFLLNFLGSGQLLEKCR